MSRYDVPKKKTKCFFKKPEKPPKNWKIENPRNIRIDYTTRKLHTKFGNPRPYSYRDMMYRKKTKCFFKKPEKPPKNWKFENPKNIRIDYTIRKLHTKFGNPRPYSSRDMMYRNLCREKKKKKEEEIPILDPNMAIFDKS